MHVIKLSDYVRVNTYVIILLGGGNERVFDSPCWFVL